MRAFIFQHWHAWQGAGAVMLSNEDTKELHDFPNVDACINWLFINGHKEAARALNAHKVATQ